MITRALLMTLLLLPSAAVAQESTSTAPVAPDSGGPASQLTLSLAGVNSTLLTPQREASRQPAPRERRRRRPSMVGYIENASIESQVRFRFDAGFGNSVPDRAEFFYAKCGCYQLDPEPFFDPEASGPGPGVPIELNFQQFYAFGEYARSDRFSAFAELPFRAIQPQGFLDFGPAYAPWPDQSGFADIRFGAKAGLYRGDNGAITLQVRASAPTGDAQKGASSDLWSIEPAVLFSGRLAERVGFEAQAGLWHPFGGSNPVPGDDDDHFSGDVLFYGVGPSFDVISGDRSSLAAVVELVGWRVINGQQTACTIDGTCTFDANGVNIANLKLGARATIADRHSIYAGYGWALTDEQWYAKILRVEYRLMFR